MFRIESQELLTLFFIISFPCDKISNFPLLYFSQLVKIQLRFFSGGLGAEPPSYLIVSCQNWKVLVGWRYDFWDIVDTISELAKAEKEPFEAFRKHPYPIRYRG